MSPSVAIAFKCRGLAPRRHGLLRIIVRVAWPWCVVCYGGKPEEEAGQRYDGCQLLDMSEDERRALRDYIPCPQRQAGVNLLRKGRG